MDDFRNEGERNKESLKKLVGLAEGYEKRVKEETELSKEQLKTRYVGKVDPKKRESFFRAKLSLTIHLLTLKSTVQISRTSASN